MPVVIPAKEIGMSMGRPSNDMEMHIRSSDDTVEIDLPERSYHFYENIHSMSNILLFFKEHVQLR